MRILNNPRHKHSFESIGDFYYADIAYGDCIDFFEEYEKFDATQSLEAIRKYFSLTTYEESEGDTRLSNEKLRKVTTKELICFYEKLLNEGEYLKLDPENLKETYLTQYEDQHENWQPEVRIYFAIRVRMTPDLTATTDPLKGLRGKLVDPFKNLADKFKHPLDDLQDRLRFPHDDLITKMEQPFGLSKNFRELAEGLKSPVSKAVRDSLAASEKLRNDMMSLEKLAPPMAFQNQMDSFTKLNKLEPHPSPYPDSSDFRLPEIPPNPTYETNKKIEESNELLKEMSKVALSTSSVIDQLNDTVLKFLIGFDKASEKATKTSNRMMWIALFTLAATCFFSLASFINSLNNTDTELQQALIKKVETLDESNKEFTTIRNQLIDLNKTDKELVDRLDKIINDMPRQQTNSK